MRAELREASSEDELRQVMRLARQGDPNAIYKFVRDGIANRVEEAIRKRCGQRASSERTAREVEWPK